MPAMFSWTELFRASYFLKIRRKTGKIKMIIPNMIAARKGNMMRKIRDMCQLMRSVMMIEKTTIKGTRTATRIIMP